MAQQGGHKPIQSRISTQTDETDASYSYLAVRTSEINEYIDRSLNITSSLHTAYLCLIIAYLLVTPDS